MKYSTQKTRFQKQTRLVKDGCRVLKRRVNYLAYLQDILEEGWRLLEKCNYPFGEVK